MNAVCCRLCAPSCPRVLVAIDSFFSTLLLEGDARIALSYWRNEVTRELGLALTAIFQESERLEANV